MYMSDIIKLNVKKNKLNVTVKNSLEGISYEEEKKEDYFQSQLEQHYEKGYSDGHKEAFEKLEKEYSDKLVNQREYFQQMLSELNAKLTEYESSFEKIVITLAIDLSEKIVKREIQRETVIPEVLKDSLKRVLGTNNVHVRLNPTDYEKILSDGEELASELDISKIKFEPDDTIEIGGCLVETEIGKVDARITSQLSEMRKQMENILTTQNGK